MKAAEQDNAAAQYALGWMYEYGEALDADMEQALSWYRQAAAQGNTDAQERLNALRTNTDTID